MLTRSKEQCHSQIIYACFCLTTLNVAEIYALKVIVHEKMIILRKLKVQSTHEPAEKVKEGWLVLARPFLWLHGNWSCTHGRPRKARKVVSVGVLLHATTDTLHIPTRVGGVARTIRKLEHAIMSATR